MNQSAPLPTTTDVALLPRHPFWQVCRSKYWCAVGVVASKRRNGSAVFNSIFLQCLQEKVYPAKLGKHSLWSSFLHQLVGLPEDWCHKVKVPATADPPTTITLTLKLMTFKRFLNILHLGKIMIPRKKCFVNEALSDTPFCIFLQGMELTREAKQNAVGHTHPCSDIRLAALVGRPGVGGVICLDFPPDPPQVDL